MIFIKIIYYQYPDLMYKSWWFFLKNHIKKNKLIQYNEKFKRKYFSIYIICIEKEEKRN